MNPMLDAALAYAARGWVVFPCKGKLPATQHGYKGASKDPEQIRKWWGKHPDWNIGLPMAPNGLLALDVDPRNGGLAGYQELMQAGAGPLDTLTQHSGRGDGGLHYVFKGDGSNLLSKPAKGVDLKWNGYIMAAPSIHPVSGRPYSWDVLAPLQPVEMSAELRRLLTRVRPPQSDHDEVGPQRWSELLDAVSHISPDERDTWLQVGMALHDARPGEEGFEAWDEWSQKTGRGNYDASAQERTWDAFRPGPVTYRTIFALAKEAGWVNEANPALSKSEAAALFASTPIVEDALPEVFVEVDDDGTDPLTGKPPAVKRAGIRFEKYEEIDVPPSATYASKGLLPAPGIATLYGDSGSAKTWTAITMAVDICLGMPFLGHYKTHAMPVAYIAAEAPSSIRQRFALLRAYGAGPDTAPLYVVHGGVDFNSPQAVQALVDGLKERGVRYVFVDTVAAVMAGAKDENTSEFSGTMVAAGLKIQAECGSGVLFIHHRGKMKEKGMRGHSSMFAAMDAVLLQEKEFGNNRLLITVEKSRDSEVGNEIEAELEVFSCGSDDEGDARSSCRVIPRKAPDPNDVVRDALEQKMRPKGEQQNRVLNIIDRLVHPLTGVTGVPDGTLAAPVDTVFAAVLDDLNIGRGEGRRVSRAQVNNLAAELRDHGFIEMNEAYIIRRDV